MPAENITIKAKWTVNQYSVTFVDEDGSTVIKEAVSYDYGTAGTAIAKPNDPTKTGYTFSGWDTIPETMPAENITIKAKWTIKSYTITWMNDDGSVFDTTVVEYGTIPSNDNVPEKAETEDYTYSFTGWTPELAAVTEAATYTAAFEQVDKIVFTLNATEAANIIISTSDSQDGTYTVKGTVTKDSTDNTVKVPAGAWVKLEYQITDANLYKPLSVYSDAYDLAGLTVGDAAYSQPFQATADASVQIKNLYKVITELSNANLTMDSIIVDEVRCAEEDIMVNFDLYIVPGINTLYIDKSDHTVTLAPNKTIINEGTISIDGSFVNNGIIISEDTFSVNSVNSFTNNASFTSNGNFNITGNATNGLSGTITNNGTISLVDGASGDELTNYGTLTNAAGSSIIIYGGAALANEGTISNSGTITINDDATLANHEDAVITNESGGTIDNNGDVTNYGTITNNAGGTLNNNSGNTLTNNYMLLNYGNFNNSNIGKIVNGPDAYFINSGSFTNASGGTADLDDASVFIKKLSDASVFSDPDDAFLYAYEYGGLIEDGGLVWFLNDGILTFANSHTIPDFSSAEEAPWYAIRDLINEIKLEEITVIGSYAFCGIVTFETINIPDASSIGDKAFYGCSYLHEAFFSGDPPTLGTDVFGNTADDFYVYYNGTNHKWDQVVENDLWYGYPAAGLV